MSRRMLEGVVESVKNDKTIKVKVERRVKHPLYKKIIKRSSLHIAHDEGNKCYKGQRVRIIESRPISKTKSWIVI